MWRGGRKTTLPVDAFDGKPFADVMHDLENEWEALLSEPRRPTATFDKTWLIDQNRQRVGNCETSIVNCQDVIDRLQVLVNRNEEALSVGHRQPRLTDYYQRQINLYQKQLATLRDRQTSLHRRRRALVYL